MESCYKNAITFCYGTLLLKLSYIINSSLIYLSIVFKLINCVSMYLLDISLVELTEKLGPTKSFLNN